LASPWPPGTPRVLIIAETSIKKGEKCEICKGNNLKMYLQFQSRNITGARLGHGTPDEWHPEKWVRGLDVSVERAIYLKVKVYRKEQVPPSDGRHDS
jgi:hypothetical protein